MRVAFCTTCKGRLEHLSRTLPKNLVDNPNARFIVLDYNCQENTARFLRQNYVDYVATGQLVVYEYKENVPFRMAHAKNMVHRLAMSEGADVLVNLDADNYTGPGFVQYVEEQFRTNDNCFLWSRMVKDGEGRLPRGISGRIAVRAETFMLTGGYDEKYEAYSPDDKDFNARLRRLGLTAVEINPVFLNAILHNDKMRYREYPHACAITEEFQVQHDHVVVNGGSVGCGTVYRNSSILPIEIKTYPTRVFGIGMHKTATTSLHQAMGMLGYRSGHWHTAHWAKAVWREMNQLGHSPTMEGYYHVCDLPIPLLFRKLDVAYPGSKFILTRRDEAKWLDSVRRHFSYEHNKYRVQWDTDPFSHRIHKVLYGQYEFNKDVFLARYRRHNAEVLDYFKDRPQDLLVMDMDNGHGWKELCEFLDIKSPGEFMYPTIVST